MENGVWILATTAVNCTSLDWRIITPSNNIPKKMSNVRYLTLCNLTSKPHTDFTSVKKEDLVLQFPCWNKKK